MNHSEQLKNILSFLLWLMDGCKTDEDPIILPESNIELPEVYIDEI
jgi:hypothetical protein